MEAASDTSTSTNRSHDQVDRGEEEGEDDDDEHGQQPGERPLFPWEVADPFRPRLAFSSPMTRKLGVLSRSIKRINLIQCVTMLQR